MQDFLGIQNVKVMDFNSSPCGKKLHIMWNMPPAQDNVFNYPELEQAVALITYMMVKNVRTICFANSRKQCEVLLKETKELLAKVAPDLVERIQSYRAGYSAEDRRLIESRIFSGEFSCIISTSALELGVDIGALDCTIHMEFSGLGEYRQQSGRAGRRERDSISILITRQNRTLDQYYVKNPKDLVERILEKTPLNLKNEIIIEGRAASELAFDLNEYGYFGNQQLISDLCHKVLRKSNFTQVNMIQAK